MRTRALGATGLEVTPLAFGAFKIGRNLGTKYEHAYELPDENQVRDLLEHVLDLGITYIDTAPAYGVSEERIGKILGERCDEFVLSTKVGETFEDGRSRFDFSADATRDSVARSARRLRRDVLDIVFVHSDGNDLAIQDDSGVVETLVELKTEGLVRAIGFSGKTIPGNRRAMDWADVLMIEYHHEDRSHEQVIDEAHARGLGVVVKKGLASGRLAAAEAIGFILDHPGVSSLIVGSLDPGHLAENVATVVGSGRSGTG